MNKEIALNELSRLRNRHVARIMTHLGEQPPYIETAIKKTMSQFAEDIENNIINSDSSEPICPIKR